MTVLKNGNVGIGTTSPVNLLDIGTSAGVHIGSGVPVGTSYALYNNGGTLMWNGSSVGGGGGGVTTFSAGTTGSTPNSVMRAERWCWRGRWASPTGYDASSASITAFNNITGYSATGVTGAGPRPILVFSTSPQITTPTFVTSATGPVIYGGTGANSTLTLHGTSNGSPSNAYVLLNPSGQGNVGIGTATPQAALDVNGMMKSGNCQVIYLEPNGDQ